VLLTAGPQPLFSLRNLRNRKLLELISGARTAAIGCDAAQDSTTRETELR